MKNSKSGSLALLMLFWLLPLCVGANPLTCQLRSVWEPYPPYQYKGENGKIRGLDIELLQAVAAAANCEVSFQHLPWKRALALLSKGLLDVGSGASKTLERSQYAHFSPSYRDEAMSIYVQRNPDQSFEFNSLAQLANSNAQVGIVIGYSYGSEFTQLRERRAFKGNVSEVLSDSLNINKLIAGRVNAILIEQFGGAQLIDQVHEIHLQLKRHPLRVKTGDIYFLFSKKSISTERLAQFNQALKQIKSSGQYKEILNSYLN